MMFVVAYVSPFLAGYQHIRFQGATEYDGAAAGDDRGRPEGENQLRRWPAGAVGQLEVEGEYEEANEA